MKGFKFFNNKLVFLKNTFLYTFKLSFYVLSIAGLIYYVNGISITFFVSPNIGISESLRLSSEIPFPAYTLCSPVVLKGNESSISEYLKHYKLVGTPPKLTVPQQNYIAAKAQLCSVSVPFIYVDGTKNRTEKNIIEVLKKRAPTIDDTFLTCSHKFKWIKCEFTRSITDVGICFTFNMQGYDTIFKENAISKDFDVFKSDKKVIIRAIFEGRVTGKTFSYPPLSFHNFITNFF